MSKCAAPRTRKLTSQMTAVELARVVANHQDWNQDGGWVCDDSGERRIAIAQGYESLAEKLSKLQIIVVGQGIDWRRLDCLSSTQIKRSR